ncbi:hypothetical protein [Yeosuana marina]|uniref:hypothetical protein n=1 Tax=Yeosuana marina TaxID=1565536 RepID=UPI0030C8837E
MGIYEFKMLSEREQYNTVFTNGQFVDTVSEGNIKYKLYTLSYFWVEVQYHNNKIMRISSFVEGEKLNRYSNFPDKI